MAGNYSVISQNREVQVLGPTEVIDVEKVGILTKPTGVYVEYPMPLVLWETRAGFDLLGQLAAGIEQQISEGLAVGGSYVQDYDANNLLVDYVEMVVQYTPTDGRPPQRTSVLIPLESFIAAGGDPFFAGLGASPQSLLSAAYDTLVATAGA
jgi:hypothetical protein